MALFSNSCLERVGRRRVTTVESRAHIAFYARIRSHDPRDIWRALAALTRDQR